MSVFVIRLIAIITMFIDHLGFALQATGKITEDQAVVMRTIGRIAYPTFAFLIVNGWKYTRDKKKYVRNMVIFGAISQIPYTLAISNFTGFKNFALSQGNFSPWGMHLNLRNFDSLGFIIIMIAAYIYYVWKDNKDWSIVPVVIAVILPFFTFYGDSKIFILLPPLSIFYTLALGMLAIASIEKIFNLIRVNVSRKTEIKDLINSENQSENRIEPAEREYNPEDSSKVKPFGLVETIFLVMITAFAIYRIGGQVDYGYTGITLIVGLYIFRKCKLVQIAFLLLWTYLYYYVQLDSIQFVAGASIPALFILFYNEKKGPSLKYLFYAFYPLHLLILGIYSCYEIYIK